VDSGRRRSSAPDNLREESSRQSTAMVMQVAHAVSGILVDLNADLRDSPQAQQQDRTGFAVDRLRASPGGGGFGEEEASATVRPTRTRPIAGGGPNNAPPPVAQGVFVGAIVLLTLTWQYNRGVYPLRGGGLPSLGSTRRAELLSHVSSGVRRHGEGAPTPDWGVA